MLSNLIKVWLIVESESSRRNTLCWSVFRRHSVLGHCPALRVNNYAKVSSLFLDYFKHLNFQNVQCCFHTNHIYLNLNKNKHGFLIDDYKHILICCFQTNHICVVFNKNKHGLDDCKHILIWCFQKNHIYVVLNKKQAWVSHRWL